MHTKKGNLKKSQPVRNTYKFSKSYTYALDTLDNYDYERLTINKTTTE